MHTSAGHAASRWLLALVAPVGCAAMVYGAVYPWAYWPLLALCLAIGAAGLIWIERSTVQARTVKRLSLGLGAIAVALALQLVPLPQSALRTLSPATDAFLARVDLTYSDAGRAGPAAADTKWHPLSVNPKRTLLACAFFAAFGVYLLGALGVLQRLSSLVAVANAIAVLGVGVALTGILLPPPAGAPAGFAPFMNRNHFTAWVSMAASLALGMFAARLAALRRRHLHGRNLLVYFGSTEGAKLILSGFAPLVMFASILLSQSRSGVLASVAGLCVMAFFAARSHAEEQRSRAVAASFVFIMLAAALWAGAEPLIARVEGALGPDLATRFRAWGDALRVARAFPLAGTGLNTYGDVMLLYQTADAVTHYSAAHNDYLQIVAEGGLLLTLPVAFAVVVFAREVRAQLAADHQDSRTYWVRRGAVAALVAIACQSLFDFSLQIPANALLFVTMCAVAVHDRPWKRARARHPLAPVVELHAVRRPLALR